MSIVFLIKCRNAFLSKNLDIAVFFGILTVSIAIEKGNKMTDIPNTEYITINKDGIFVGGKPATTYCGEKILFSNGVREAFADIQRLNKNVAELHVLSSETFGEYAKVGNPSGNHGRTAWCRVKFENGNLGAWVCLEAHGSAADCANVCANFCARHVRLRASFRSAVFDAVDKEKTPQKPINPVVVATNNNAQNKR